MTIRRILQAEIFTAGEMVDLAEDDFDGTVLVITPTGEFHSTELVPDSLWVRITDPVTGVTLMWDCCDDKWMPS